MRISVYKKRVLLAAAVFLAMMLLATLVSRGVYAGKLPQVETQRPVKAAIGHTVEAEGYIEAGSESAVSGIPGLKVDRIYVKPGDSVSGNTLLFTVDEEQLAETIAEQELAVKKLELEAQQLKMEQELAAQKGLLARDRSLEDYALTDTEEDRKIDQAAAQVARAEEKLAEHMADQPEMTSEEKRKEENRQYTDWQQTVTELRRQLLTAQSALTDATEKETAAREALEKYEVDGGGEMADGGGNGGSGGTGTAGGDNGGNAEAGGNEGGSVAAGGGNGGSGGTDTSGRGSGGNRAADGDGGGGIAAGDSKAADTVSGNTSGAGGTSDANTDPEDDNDSGADDTNPPNDSGLSTTGGSSDTPGDDDTYEQLAAAAAQATAARQEAEERVKKLERSIEELELDTKTKPDYTGEDAARKSWESTRESLEDAVEDAKTSQENTVWDKLDAMLEAKRAVEDAAAADRTDLTLEINELELTYRKEILTKYKKLEAQQGCVYSEEEGIVTGIGISSGEPLPNGTAISLARLDEAFRFKCTLTKEEAKYVSLGDTVSLKLGSSQKIVQAEIGYRKEIASSPGTFEVWIYLPQGVGSVGMSGTMTVSVQSESYPVTIPARAVYRDNEQSYCYVLRRQQGILGEEYAVTRTLIRVLDENSKYAAVEEGMLDGDSEVIISTTRELEDGKVVRLGSEE